jgi:ribosomal protein S18 acetylase RimI-like enzyme
MAIIVKPATTRSEMKTFIYLPEIIHANHKGWVPPFFADDKRTFDPKRNLSFAYCECVCLLAYENGIAVGRVAGIINHRYNKNARVQNARFGYMEVPARLDVTAALLNYVETWAKGKGMTKLVGPMGFTEEDPEAFIIEGFEEITNLATNQNFPQIPEYMAQLGYTKEVDYFVYKVKIADAITDLYRKVFQRVSRSKELKLMEFKTKKELARYIVPIFRLMNQSFTVLYGYSPFEEEEMVQFAKRYMPGVDPRFIKCVVNAQDEVVGFVVGIPNMSSGIIKARGRLFPFGFIHILSARKHSKKLDVYLGAVKEEYRSKGVDVLMGYKMFETAQAAGIEYLDSHHELEDNIAMRSEMERVGGKIYKKYRIFQKNLIS